MAAPRGITLYHSPASRAFTAYWMLEELGAPFAVKTVDIRKGEQKQAAYLKLNPAGKVPTLTDGEVVVSENPAIAIYLADRYGYGTLAPRIDDPDRGPYLKWMVYLDRGGRPGGQPARTEDRPAGLQLQLRGLRRHGPGAGAVC